VFPNVNFISVRLTISGLVQGVGFRPFIYRIAKEQGLKGWVRNTSANVEVLVQGEPLQVRGFISRIYNERPPASKIYAIDEVVTYEKSSGIFEILPSAEYSDKVTEISPDIAVCDDCLTDLQVQPHRINYPLINCTHCGPRFSIIESLPYDRERTSMKSFVLCDLCEKEYKMITDRRFHAQPVACNHCGPSYLMVCKERQIPEIGQIIDEAARLLNSGEVLAIKATGGYHLCCDALQPEAVEKVRKIKQRDAKPFAVMFRNPQEMNEFVFLSDEERNLVSSWQRPVVLLKTRRPLAPMVSAGLNTTGAMLPYMAFHYMLFEKLTTPAIVLTSANLSDAPIITDDHEAHQVFGPVTAGVISYNRVIVNRVDDPVLFVAGKRHRLIRRSRSFVPAPVKLTVNTEGILATGAELVNTFAIGKAENAILSQHIGDLKNADTFDFYTETIERFKTLFRFSPSLIACDMHPDYLSTRYALETGLPVVYIQHHHAHIGSCMAEHSLDEMVTGISFDGTGYGTDGTIWGGEVLKCDLNEMVRFAHFKSIPLPGGDKAVEQPWRSAVSFLYAALGRSMLELPVDFLRTIPSSQIESVIEAIDKKINAPLCSSAGRLFDAVAAILNYCTVSSFHAEAPMRLENALHQNTDQFYSVPFNKIFDTPLLIKQITNDLVDGTDKTVISAKFHNTVAEYIFTIAEQMRNEFAINKVVLSGGVFQNRYLLEQSEAGLIYRGFKVFSHSEIPANDGGISLGQLLIAAKRRQLCV